MANSSCSERRKLEDMPDVLSVAEVAEALGVGLSTVRHWIKAGELATLALSGDRLLVPKEQLYDLIEKANGRRRRLGSAP